MKHISLKLQKLEERIAPGGICCYPCPPQGSNGHGSKGGGGSKSHGSKSHGSKSGGHK